MFEYTSNNYGYKYREVFPVRVFLGVCLFTWHQLAWQAVRQTFTTAGLLLDAHTKTLWNQISPK